MDLERRRARMNKMWSDKTPWEGIVRECFDYFMPNRRAGGYGRGPRTPTQIFDMTGPNSARHFPGELKRILIPDGQPFTARTGPLISSKLKREEKQAWDMRLGQVAEGVYPFFQTGGFDQAINDAFTDLAVTNAYILPMRGPSIEEPLFFVALPTEQCAVIWDAFGRLSVLNWKKEVSVEQVIQQWPVDKGGKYTAEFLQRAKDKPDEKVTLCQEFERAAANDGGGWKMCAYLDKGEEIITPWRSRTQPVAALRFYVTPGDDYSLGPVPFTLPTVKVQNKAQELVLKAFAIQMLGIWAYRAGGTFNPNNVRLGPGEFWGMESTGGLLGPDVQRLDAATGRLDLARMLLSAGQQQIRDALLDTRIMDDGGTPASASEIAAKVRQNANTHLGAYGRVINDLLPVLVPRGMEILNEWKLLPDLMNFNQLLVSMEVVSPMARAMRIADFEAASQYAEFIGLMEPNPAAHGLYVVKEELAAAARDALMVPVRLIPNEEQKKQVMQEMQAERQQQMLAEMATKAAPQIAQGLMAPEMAEAA